MLCPKCCVWVTSVWGLGWGSRGSCCIRVRRMKTCTALRWVKATSPVTATGGNLLCVLRAVGVGLLGMSTSSLPLKENSPHTLQPCATTFQRRFLFTIMTCDFTAVQTAYNMIGLMNELNKSQCNAPANTAGGFGVTGWFPLCLRSHQRVHRLDRKRPVPVLN